MFFDMRSREDASNKSYRNHKEAKLILSFLECLAPCLSDMSIAVISPYKSQVQLIRRELEGLRLSSARNDSRPGSEGANLRIEVNTVDGFQGREKDFVIVSAVRTSTVGFLADNRRLNVAITRAKRCLIVVGHRATLEKDKMWGAMLDDLCGRSCIFAAPDSGSFKEYVGYADLLVGINDVIGIATESEPFLQIGAAQSEYKESGSEDGEISGENKGESVLNLRASPDAASMRHTGGGAIRKRTRESMSLDDRGKGIVKVMHTGRLIQRPQQSEQTSRGCDNDKDDNLSPMKKKRAQKCRRKCESAKM